MTSFRSGQQRGQNLVMMALTVLLMTLMVMMTISIGSKVKEKMELQTLSDSAAYSQAVVTARTFNAVATMNRVGIAHVVGTVAVQSLVSWATYAYANMLTAQRQYDRWNRALRTLARVCCFPRSPCDTACPGCRLGRTDSGIYLNLIRSYNLGIRPLFMALDFQAWLEALAYLTSADFVHLFGSLPTYLFMSNFLNNQSGISTLVNRARPGTPYNELQVDGSPDGVNFDEVMPLGGAFYPLNPIYWHHAFAAMGSRLHPFLTNRTAASMLINMRLMMPPFSPRSAIFFQVGRGSGYVTLPPREQHGSSMIRTLFARHFSADDHSQGGGLAGGYLGDFFGCYPLWNRPQTNRTRASIWSNQAFGRHEGTNFTCPYIHNVSGLGRAYPWFMDYNFLLLTSQDNVWGQPKNFGIVYRDLAARPTGGADQWNPFFRFNFTGAGATYDQRGIRTLDGQNISRQVGFSTGITYYHRGNNLFGYHSGSEPPNLFNPYWRAGLTRVNVDDPRMGGGDVRNALSGYPAAIDAFNGLENAGFKGWQ